LCVYTYIWGILNEREEGTGQVVITEEKRVRIAVLE
jgi:hypothetical protein